MDEMINVKTYILELANVCTDNASVIEDFVQFMEDNDWFQISPVVQQENGDDVLYFKIDDAERIRDNVIFFLQNKDVPLEEKCVILLNELNKQYPETSEYLREFYENIPISESIKFQIFDFLLYFLNKDLFLYSDNDMNTLINKICDYLSLRVGNILVDFISWLKDKHSVSYTNDFILNSRITESRIKHAYDNDKYLNLVYYLFNSEYIEENSMYELASENKNTADTWLYLSLHLICALRDTDLVRLPHPRLRFKPEDILERVTNNQFSDSDALLAVNSVLWQLKNVSIVPNKTLVHSSISDIKLLIPDSAMVHFGVLFAVAEAHNILAGHNDKPLIRTIKDYESISKYLGEEIGDLFLEEDFSPRSATKSYMQAVEMFGDKVLENEDSSVPHAKGYMLAALARSHKSSYGEFAHTTEVYLKDANFSGYSAEFIAKELLERGVCSFIPSMLLKMVTDGEYEKLSVSKQTKLVQELGLSPIRIEKSLSLVDESIEKAKEIVNKIISEKEENRESVILNILHNIGCGNAVSKQESILCLMTAVGNNCPNIETRQCIGCKYEISTKATIYVLISEFNRLLALREETDKEYLKNKYTLLLKETIAPAMAEIFSCVKEQYGEDALREMEQVIKEAQNEY